MPRRRNTFLKAHRSWVFLALLSTLYGLSAWLLYYWLSYVPQQSWTIPESYCRVAQISRDHSTMLLLSNDWLQVRDLPSGNIRYERRFEKSNSYPLYHDTRLSPDGSLLFYRTASGAKTDSASNLLVETRTGHVLLTAKIRDDEWGYTLPSFTSDGRSIIYASKPDNEALRLVVWDVLARNERFKLPREEYHLACCSGTGSQGEMLALLNATHHRVELWKLSTGECWKKIPLNTTALQIEPDWMWFSQNGKSLFLVSSYSREDQIKWSWTAATTVVTCATASLSSLITSIAVFDDRSYEYGMYLFFLRSKTTEHWVECLDIATDKVSQTDFKKYAASDSTFRYLLRRVVKQTSSKPIGFAEPDRVEIFDIETNRPIAQVPVFGISHQVDSLSHNADLGEDFQIHIVAQNNTIIVGHDQYRPESTWGRIRDWLGEKLPSLQRTEIHIENDYDIHFYDASTGQESVSLLDREYDCFSEDGKTLATRRSSPSDTIIELWDWPLRRPWWRILGWPAMVIAMIVLLAWVRARFLIPKGLPASVDSR